MTETEWLKAKDPEGMLAFLRNSGKFSPRKARLLACACVRRVGQWLTDDRSRRAVEVAERFADLKASDAERSEVRRVAQEATESRGITDRPRRAKWERRAASAAYWVLAREVNEAVFHAPDLVVEALIWRQGGHNNCDWQRIQNQEKAAQVALLRDLFGPLPFRPITLSPPLRTWNSGTLVRLATGIYEERAFTPERMGVLADALEEAGCESMEVIEHCRGPGVHVRGCWAVDAILGRE